MKTSFEEYIGNYRWHFNRKSCDYAVSLMKRMNPATGKEEKIEPMSKDATDEFLTKHNVHLEKNEGYDYVYVINMLRADMYRSSIPDDAHLALGVKDIIDDIDAAEGSVLRCWMAKMYAAGKPIFWDEYL